MWTFLHTTKKFSDTSWVSYISNQLWHCLPGDSIRPHRLRPQSHGSALFRCQSPVQVVNCTSDHDLSLGLIDLLEQHTELRKPISSLDYQFISKDIKEYKSTDKWENNRVKFWTKELPSSWSLGLSMVSCASALVPRHEGSPKPSFWVFTEAHFRGMIYGPPVISSTTSPSTLPGNQKVGLRLLALYSWLVPLAMTSPNL